MQLHRALGCIVIEEILQTQRIQSVRAKWYIFCKFGAIPFEN